MLAEDSKKVRLKVLALKKKRKYSNNNKKGKRRVLLSP